MQPGHIYEEKNCGVTLERFPSWVFLHMESDVY